MMTNVISDNIASQQIKNSDNSDYKFLPPIPSKPPIIISEPVSVNSNPLSSTNSFLGKQPRKLISSNTITPGERLYRQGIELLEKKRTRTQRKCETIRKTRKNGSSPQN